MSGQFLYCTVPAGRGHKIPRCARAVHLSRAGKGGRRAGRLAHRDKGVSRGASGQRWPATPEGPDSREPDARSRGQAFASLENQHGCICQPF